MVVGEVHPDATATIIGIGEVRSAGVSAGEIAEPSMVRQCVSDAWIAAQNNTDVDIVNVVLAVTGEHIYGENNVGSYRLPDTEKTIMAHHVYEADRNAEEVEIPRDHFVLHRELGGYSVDGKDPCLSPEGLTGRTLDVNCHVIHGVSTRLQNSLFLVRDVPLEVDRLVFAPLAAAQVALNRQQKEAGALLIDIGGGTTDYICYMGGDIVASGCIPAGGNTICRKIMEATGMTFAAAEALKCAEGNAAGNQSDNEVVQHSTDTGFQSVISRGLLNQIIYNCLWTDILEKVRDSVITKLTPKVWEQARLSVYFTGGTSLMRGLEVLALRAFNKPVYMHHTSVPLDRQKPSYLANPRYCTAIGLIRYAQRYDEEKAMANPGLMSRCMTFVRTLFSRN